jgi:N-acetyl-gamma-glutamylphosphate reductase
MKALIIGATGATGKDLVNALLQDPENGRLEGTAVADRL